MKMSKIKKRAVKPNQQLFVDDFAVMQLHGHIHTYVHFFNPKIRVTTQDTETVSVEIEKKGKKKIK